MKIDKIILISLSDIYGNISKSRRRKIINQLNQFDISFDEQETKNINGITEDNINTKKDFSYTFNRIKDQSTGSGDTSFIWLNAINGNFIPKIKEGKAHDCTIGIPKNRKKVFPGEIGCWLSHRKAWKYIMENDYENILIIEDDADFKEDIFKIKEFDNLDYNMLYFGRSFFEIVKNKYIENYDEGMHETILEYDKYEVKRCTQAWRTQAYCVKKDVTPYLLMNTTVIDRGIDDKLSRMISTAQDPKVLAFDPPIIHHFTTKTTINRR